MPDTAVFIVPKRLMSNPLFLFLMTLGCGPCVRLSVFSTMEIFSAKAIEEWRRPETKKTGAGAGL